MIDKIADVVGNDVLVGDDIAVLIDNESGAGLFAFEGLLRDLDALAAIAEEAAEEVLAFFALVVVLLGLAAAAEAGLLACFRRIVGRDVDDARVELARKLGEFVAHFL